MEISPLAVDVNKDLIGRLELSDSDEEMTVPPLVRMDARSPENNHSNVSTSSTETIPTAREVTRNVAVTPGEAKEEQREMPDPSQSLEENMDGKVKVASEINKSMDWFQKVEGQDLEIVDCVKDKRFDCNSEHKEFRPPESSMSAQTPVLNKESVEVSSERITDTVEVADRTEFLQTLHDTNKILMEIKSSIGSDRLVTEQKVSEDSMKENTEKEVQEGVNVETGDGDLNGNQNVSNSTIELLTADVGVLDLSDSDSPDRSKERGKKSILGDTSGTFADISDSVHSSAILKDSSRESLREDLSFPASHDYIPKCNTDCVIDEISSVENSVDHGKDAGLPNLLIRQMRLNCSHSSGHSTDHPSESSCDPITSYTHSSFLTDSVSFHERDSGCSPRKHKRKDRRRDPPHQQSSSSASQSVVFPEGSYAGQGKHRDRSYLGNVLRGNCI